ncbi:S41 family peptidase [Salisaeta longa]|uniref:S41 family peptidase n=1 Tax=Salisaeta longa TaxID=503170 RepID=UPI0004082362|nr:S41 family peptidase [Salisaeta longa]
MTRRLLLVCAMLLGTVGAAAAQDDTPLVRFPALSPDGESVVVSYQGDLWMVPATGGRAQRLTVHEAYDAHARWSPNGSQIAFTSDRYGNDDVFVMSSTGGRPERLTYHEATDALGGWTPDGALLFSTDRMFVQAEWAREIHRVSAQGGTPQRVLNAVGYMPRMSPDGRFIAIARGANRITKKGYTGPANKNLWIYDTQNETYQQLTTEPHNDYAPVWAGPRTLLFISERTGTYNVHRLALTDAGAAQGAPEAITTFTDTGVRAFSASADGQRIAFERATSVYVMDVGGAPERLNITVPSDYRYLPTTKETLTNGLRDYAVSPDGDQVAFVVRGEIFVKDLDPEESRAVRLTTHAYRDRDVTWLSDSTLAFVSDRAGDQYDVYRLASSDPETTDLYEALTHRVTRLTSTPEDERLLALAPNRERIAFRRGSFTGYGAAQLLTAPVTADGFGEETVLVDSWSAPERVAWSPDSKWLAYARPNLNFNNDIFIHAADGSRAPVNVSQHPRGDYQPVWSPDGSKLAFVSERSGGSRDVWFAWLTEEDWEKTKRDWQELTEEKTEGDAAKDAADDTPPTVEIDFEGLYERMVRVTALPANESSPVFTKDGDTIYFVAGQGGRTGDYDTDVDLYRIKWDGTERTRVTEGDRSPRGVRLGPAAEHVYFVHGRGQLARVPAGKDALERLPFRAEMTIDHAAERQQIFSEVWSALNLGFYDPEFHGDDWGALREQYRPWALSASTMRDFADMVNLMLGELNASHMGYYAGDRAETGDTDTGLLGVALQPVANGVRVERVVPRGPADREMSRLYAGDVITAVNGQSVAEVPNVYALLDGTVGEEVLLTVAGDDGTRRVRIRPTADLDDELYREWVEERQRLVEEYSNGRLGYIHIEGMNWVSFERFERELYANAHNKEGLIIDVRYNGGGWTTDYLMTVLNVRRHAYTVPRGATQNLDANHTNFRAHYPFGERLPFAAWTKPTAALANNNSYSNAEIFSHAFKNLNHGPLIGEPTFGAVISTGGARLIDGSYVRMPFRGWYVYQTNKNMEHGPAVPDVMVSNPPDAKAKGNDPQLRRAVNELLETIGGQSASATE